jgi:hypothetical protein
LAARSFSVLLAGLCLAAQAAPPPDPVLVIYSGGFALVRQPIELDLQSGENEVSTSAVTRSLDPPSVILRDPSRRADWQVIEQRFRSEPISERLMLDRMKDRRSRFAGATTERCGRCRGKSCAVR